MSFIPTLVLEEHQVELLEKKIFEDFLNLQKLLKTQLWTLREVGYSDGGDFWAGKINNSGPDFQVGVDRNPRRFCGICL